DFHVSLRSTSGLIAPGTGWKTPSCTLWKKPLRDESAAKLCSPNSRRPCSLTPYGVTRRPCLNNNQDGSRERVIPSWGKASDCFIAAFPIRGLTPSPGTRWEFRDPLLWNAL